MCTGRLGVRWTRAGHSLRHIRQGSKRLEEEPVAKAVQELQKSSTHSLQSAEWSERDGLLYYHGCIYIPNASNLCRRIVSFCHDTKVACHPGRLPELLVAEHVTVCRSVCLPLQLLPLH